jgi:hypothetical protein
MAGFPTGSERGTAFEIYPPETFSTNMDPSTNHHKTPIFIVYLLLLTMLYSTLFFLGGYS